MAFPTQTPPSSGQGSTGSNNFDLMITIASGVVSAVISKLIYDYIKSKRIRIKQIKSSKDPDLNGFVDLYNTLIDDDIRIDASEIIRWIDEDRALRKMKSHKYYHYLFVGKIDQEVVSFLKVMYCTDSKYLFVAYYGINTTIEQARLFAAPLMMKTLVRLVQTEIKDCKAVLCEVQKPQTQLEQAENDKRKARLRLFKETARILNFRLFEIDFEYLQPRMEIERDQRQQSEESMILLYAPIKDEIPFDRQLPKNKLLEILKFIYLQIYRPTYRHEPEKDFIYQSYLNSLLELYEHLLPDYIPLKD